ncbi:ankyrin repeat-containing domain protein [Xylariaceae sp. FL1019]|nr:ankyrin repeat-containing domain protein [Xylariaceae sp. FL1019]
MKATRIKSPISGLEIALADFSASLGDGQRRELTKIRNVPDADSVLVFTAHLDAAKNGRKRRSIASRVCTVLTSVRDISSIIDTFISSNPTLAALVWGSIKLTLQIIVNFASYFETTSGFFLALGQSFPLFTEYATLYQNSKGLQEALAEFSASVVRSCQHLVAAIQRPWRTHAFKALYTSFEREFRPDKDDIQRHGAIVKNAIELAKANVEAQEREIQAQERSLQIAERVAAKEDRKLLVSFDSRQKKESEHIRMLLLQRETREAQKKKYELLNKLSRYRPEKSLKQNQRKRFCNTATWIFETPQFREWQDINRPPVFLCTGKSQLNVVSTAAISLMHHSRVRKKCFNVGIITDVLNLRIQLIHNFSASVIDHLLLKKPQKHRLISYFFIHSGEKASLNAETVVRSILRQTLPDASVLSDQLAKRLQCIDHHDSLDAVVELLSSILSSANVSYIVIDGLDACERDERWRLIESLVSLTRKTANIKIFFAARESIYVEVREQFEYIYHVEMDSPCALIDVESCIEGFLQEKIKTKALRLGDQRLLDEIREALAKGADGMLLWVFFQIEDICDQLSDNAIRKAIASLPRTLEETYDRLLHRIIMKHPTKDCRLVFLWTATTVRPLSIAELREAIAIEIGQRHTIQDRLCNDMSRLISSCENLLHVDEEDQSVQFAHHSIKQHLLRPSTDPSLAILHVNKEFADHFVGEICMTYLEFSDFNTALQRKQKPVVLPRPSEIVSTTIGPRWEKTLRLSNRLGKHKVAQPMDIAHFLQSRGAKQTSGACSTNEVSHPFVKYASVNWIVHSSRFQEARTKTWSSWSYAVMSGHTQAHVPWEPTHSKSSCDMFTWALSTHHYALMHLVASERQLSDQQVRSLLTEAIYTDDGTLIGILSKHCTDIRQQASEQLNLAARCGSLAVMQKMLAVHADPNYRANVVTDHTALQLASRRGRIDIVKALLGAGANVNDPGLTYGGHTALQSASIHGHFGVVCVLLAAGADDIAPGVLGEALRGGQVRMIRRIIKAGAKSHWAFQGAVEQGRANDIKLLFAAGANLSNYDLLRVAACHGYLNVVKLLLEKGTGTHSDANQYLVSALVSAARNGYVDIVKALLHQEVDVNKTHEDVTALSAAASNGRIAIVKILLRFGADTNQTTSHGTAFEVAANHGHLDIVKILLDSATIAQTNPGRDVAFIGAVSVGRLDLVRMCLDSGANACHRGSSGTVLSIAAEHGHTDIVETLLQYGANINQDSGSALRAGVSKKHRDVVKLLLERGADVNADHPENGTALEASIVRANLDIIEALIAAGADVNVSWKTGLRPYGTSLIKAIALGNVEGVNRLVNAGADIHAKNDEDITALDVARQSYLSVHPLRKLVEKLQSG